MTILQTRRGPVEIRELAVMEEMIAAEELQRQVWGAGTYPHPKELLIPIQHEGGLLAGAFTSSGELVSLIFGFRTREPGVMHSQLLATLPDWRGLGIGERLKWFQRDWCLAQGIQRVRWTVDPLRAANASLNIRRLGGNASVYYPDYYGPMQGIDAGAPTDRLLVDWQLDSPRVEARAGSPPDDHGFPGFPEALKAEDSLPPASNLDLDEPAVLVRLPADYIGMTRSQPALALAWRSQSRAVFLHYLARGYRAVEFTQVGGAAYLLQKGDAPYGN